MNLLERIEKYINEASKSPMKDEVFCFTGFRNIAWEKEIERLGGEVSRSVNKDTSILIMKTLGSNSAKEKKAKELGIDIISKEDFQKKYLKNKLNDSECIYDSGIYLEEGSTGTFQYNHKLGASWFERFKKANPKYNYENVRDEDLIGIYDNGKHIGTFKFNTGEYITDLPLNTLNKGI